MVLVVGRAICFISVVLLLEMVLICLLMMLVSKVVDYVLNGIEFVFDRRVVFIIDSLVSRFCILR